MRFKAWPSGPGKRPSTLPQLLAVLSKSLTILVAVESAKPLRPDKPQEAPAAQMVLSQPCPIGSLTGAVTSCFVTAQPSPSRLASTATTLE